MDFKGQQLSERMGQLLVTIFAVVAFLLGYALNSLNLMISVFTSGVAIAFLATVLDWPMYNRDPVKWLPAKKQQASAGRGTPGVARAPKRPQRTASNFWGLFR